MYPVKRFRVLLASFVTAIFSLLLALFAILLWGSNIHAFQKHFLDESKEMVMLLKNLSINEPEPKQRVFIAAAINKMVEKSRKDSKEVYIREAFFIDKEGNLIAHSNPIAMSSETPLKYDDPKYKKVLLQSREDPILTQALKYRETSLGARLKYLGEDNSGLAQLLGFFFPERIVSEYSVGVAHYTEGSAQALSSLHLVTEVDIAKSLLSPWDYYQVRNLYFMLFLALLILCFVYVGHYYDPSSFRPFRLSRKRSYPTVAPQIPAYGHGSPVLPMSLPPQAVPHAPLAYPPPAYPPAAAYPPVAYPPVAYPPVAYPPSAYPPPPQQPPTTAEAIPLD